MQTGEHVKGPLRVFPGKLSVSRALGDFYAKNDKAEGNSSVVIPTPEIKYLDINDSFDFIVLGCDGIFDKLKNKELLASIWKTPIYSNAHQTTGLMAENAVAEALRAGATDNLSVILVGLGGLQKKVEARREIKVLTDKTNKTALNRQFFSKGFADLNLKKDSVTKKGKFIVKVYFPIVALILLYFRVIL